MTPPRAVADRTGARPDGALIEMRGVRKVYATGSVTVEALRGVDLAIRKGEFVAIVGPSGSGKSTLMNIMGCLDTPTSGTYVLGGEAVAGLPPDRLAGVRNRRIGFVFQNFNLLPHLTAYQNVELPLVFGGVPAARRRARVEALLARVGLADRARHRPTELSGGQMQRVAAARALAMEPDIILADEPTGNLDTASGQDVLSLFVDLWRQGHTLVVITHDAALARRAARVVTIQDGRIVADEIPPAPERNVQAS